MLLQHIMLEIASVEEGHIIKDVKKLFWLEKLKRETTDTKIIGKINLFRLEKKMSKLKIEYLEMLETFLN